MLILTRKIGEKILIQIPNYADIVVEIVDLQGSRIQVGITAPEEINIVREELLITDHPF